MEFAHVSTSFLSILPPAVAILLAIFSRNVLLSLGAGIFTGALLLMNCQPLATLTKVGHTFLSVVWKDGELALGNICLLYTSPSPRDS